MSWITRCPACGVTYKLVPDQLKVAQGWLRCGQCQQAFDSTGLVLKWPLETQANKPGADPELGLGAMPIEPTLNPQGVSERVDLDDFLKQEDRSAAHSTVTAVAAFEEALSTFAPQALAPTSAKSEVFGVPLDAMLVRDADQNEQPQAQPPQAQNRQAPQPSRSWWPVTLVVGLCLALALQWVWVGRHLLMAAEPAWKQPLQTLCRHLGCKMAPPPLRDGVVIDNASLTPLDGGFELLWSVRNVTTQALEMPALELIWLDAQDKVLVRRVLTLTEQGAPQSLAAGQVWSGQLRMWSADGLQPLGYRLVNFYP